MTWDQVEGNWKQLKVVEGRVLVPIDTPQENDMTRPGVEIARERDVTREEVRVITPNRRPLFFDGRTVAIPPVRAPRVNLQPLEVNFANFVNARLDNVIPPTNITEEAERILDQVNVARAQNVLREEAEVFHGLEQEFWNEPEL